jgi:hypothetical protein
MATTSGVRALLAFARSGATVYASYFAGTGKDQVGPWMPWMEQIFGVKHQLRYGLSDTIAGDEVTFHFVNDVGEITAGQVLRFPVDAQGVARAYLPVEPDGAEVLAVDGEGRPALLRNADGAGWMVLCTYPLEHMASRRPAANPEPTWQIYSALATSAGVARPLRAEDPRVIVGGLQVGESDAYVVLNVSPEEISTKIVAPGKSIYLAGTSEHDSVSVLALGPYEVALLYAN